jgi:regulator of replication initiation timing
MKALVGAWDHTPQKLLAEITALRTKVAQLTAELADLRAENAVLRELRDVGADELAGTSA